MKSLKPNAVRAAGLIAMICLCAMAVLYVGGAFEFSFISRRPLTSQLPDVPPSPPVSIETGGQESTGPAQSETGPEQNETGSGSETVSSDTDSPVTAPPETEAPTPPLFSPSSAYDLQQQGYKITYNKYHSGMVIASVPLKDAPIELLTGKKPYREAVKEFLYDDETFAKGTMQMTKVDRYSVETYMEYILVASSDRIFLYDSYGNFLVSAKDLAPAYTRDREDRPLFFLSEKEEYYYFDDETKMILLSDYNDLLDSRGVYFNYNLLYGKSDSGLLALAQEMTYYRYFIINLGSSYEKLNIDPILARDLWEMYPKYATKVARVNMRFAVALTEAKREIAAEQAAQTTLPETTISPEETTSPDTSAEQTTPVEPSVSETLASPETTAPEITTPSDTISPETTDGAGTSDDAQTTIPPETTVPETTAPETTSPYPSDAVEGTITLEKELFGYRFGFGYSPENMTYAYSLTRAYNFVGGRAAVVLENGTLVFFNTRYRQGISGYGTYSKKIEGTDASVWFYVNYYEPLYRDIRGFGHLYYDSGYVMVRKAEIEKMRNKRVGDDFNILLDHNGNEVAIPSGYTLITCTEGIMTLERLGRYGYYDPASQTWIASPVYSHAEPFYEGMGVLQGQDGKYGVIDREGNTVIPFEFDYLSMMSNGLISAYIEDIGWQVFAKMEK